MSNRLHLTADVRERAVRAIQDGMTRQAMSATYGLDRVTLYRWFQKHTLEGDVGLERKSGSGRRRKLEELDEDTLRALILKGGDTYRIRDRSLDRWAFASSDHGGILDRVVEKYSLAQAA